MTSDEIVISATAFKDVSSIQSRHRVKKICNPPSERLAKEFDKIIAKKPSGQQRNLSTVAKKAQTMKP